MPRYFFHVRENDTVFEDKHGLVFDDISAACAWAVQDARMLVAQGAVGQPLAEHWIEIGDEKGDTVATFSFARAVLN